MATFSYRVYGLGIQSEIRLGELVPTPSPTDVQIRLGRVDGLPPYSPDIRRMPFRATPDEIRTRFEDRCALLVRGGNEIIVDPDAGVEERSLSRAILGPAIALALHQRGQLILHASAVAIGGGAIAFLGRSGGGKSTTAAALHLRGHPLVADDVVAVQLDSGAPLVAPGSPHLKLSPDVLCSLGDVPEELPRIDDGYEKRVRRADRAFSQTALPLRRLYVLAEGDDTRIEPLAPSDAFVALLRNSYMVQAENVLEATGTKSLHFRQCAQLPASVPIFRIQRRWSLEALPELAELIERDQASGESRT